LVIQCNGFVTLRWEHKKATTDWPLAAAEVESRGAHAGKYAPWSAHEYGGMGFLHVGASGADEFSLGFRLPDGSTQWYGEMRSLKNVEDVHALLSALCAATTCFLLREAREEWVRFCGPGTRILSYFTVLDDPRSHLPPGTLIPDPPVLLKNYGMATAAREGTSRDAQWASELENFYKAAAEVEGLERGLRCAGTAGDRAFLVFPVGLPIRSQESRDHAQAITHLTLTLSQLHELGLCHNDVRWANVVLAVTPRGRRWMLIDCEYGARIGAPNPLLPSNPTLADRRADGMREATELRDIRSLGLMIKEIAAHLPPAVVELASALCSDSDSWKLERGQAFGKLVAIARR
jgi:hypothetical protein